MDEAGSQRPVGFQNSATVVDLGFLHLTMICEVPRSVACLGSAPLGGDRPAHRPAGALADHTARPHYRPGPSDHGGSIVSEVIWLSRGASSPDNYGKLSGELCAILEQQGVSVTKLIGVKSVDPEYLRRRRSEPPVPGVPLQDMNDIAIGVLAAGAYDGIKAAVKLFLERHQDGHVAAKILDEEARDDFLKNHDID